MRGKVMIKEKKIFKSSISSRGLIKLTKDRFIKVLDNSKTFNHFNRTEKSLLYRLSNHLVFHKKDEYILHEGENGDSLYILLKGNVVIKKNVNKSVILATLGPGEVFGEISVFLPRKRNSNIISKDATILLEIDMPVLKKLGEVIEKKFYRLAIETLAIKLDRTNGALVEVSNALSKAKSFSIANLHDNLR